MKRLTAVSMITCRGEKINSKIGVFLRDEHLLHLTVERLIDLEYLLDPGESFVDPAEEKAG